MEDQQEVELIIASRDEEVISELERALQAINVTRGRTARTLDLVTILTIAAGVVKLVNELLTLREKLKTWNLPPEIKVRGVSGEPVDLATVDREELTRLVCAE